MPPHATTNGSRLRRLPDDYSDNTEGGTGVDNDDIDFDSLMEQAGTPFSSLVNLSGSGLYPSSHILWRKDALSSLALINNADEGASARRSTSTASSILPPCFPSPQALPASCSDIALISDVSLVFSLEFVVNICGQLMLLKRNVAAVYVCTTGMLVRRVEMRPPASGGGGGRGRVLSASEVEKRDDARVFFFTTGDASVWVQCNEDGLLHEKQGSEAMAVWMLACQDSDKGFGWVPTANGGGQFEVSNVSSSSSTRGKKNNTASSLSSSRSSATPKTKGLSGKAKKQAWKKAKRQERREEERKREDAMKKANSYDERLKALKDSGCKNVEDFIDSVAAHMINSGLEEAALDPQVVEIGNGRPLPEEGVRSSALIQRMSLVIEILRDEEVEPLHLEEDDEDEFGRAFDALGVGGKKLFLDTSVRAELDPLSAFKLMSYAATERVLWAMLEHLHDMKRRGERAAAAGSSSTTGRGVRLDSLGDLAARLHSPHAMELIRHTMGRDPLSEVKALDARVASIFEGYQMVDATEMVEFGQPELYDLVASWRRKCSGRRQDPQNVLRDEGESSSSDDDDGEDENGGGSGGGKTKKKTELIFHIIRPWAMGADGLLAHMWPLYLQTHVNSGGQVPCTLDPWTFLRTLYVYVPGSGLLSFATPAYSTAEIRQRILPAECVICQNTVKQLRKLVAIGEFEYNPNHLATCTTGCCSACFGCIDKMKECPICRGPVLPVDRSSRQEGGGCGVEDAGFMSMLPAPGDDKNPVTGRVYRKSHYERYLARKMEEELAAARSHVAQTLVSLPMTMSL